MNAKETVKYLYQHSHTMTTEQFETITLELTATEQKLAKAVRALEDAEVAYNAIISLTPTSRQREKLTEMNILRLEAIKEIKK